MRFRLRQLWALTGLTVLEVVRQPICLLLVTTCVLLMALASAQAHQFGEDGKFARDSALSIQFVFGLLVAGYGASTALTRELRSGTASAVLTKPVERDTFFLAKFLGVTAVILLFSACAIPAVLLCEKAAPKLYVMDRLALGTLILAPLVAYVVAGAANYFLRWQFASTAFWLLIGIMLAGIGLSATLYDPDSAIRVVRGQMVFVNAAIQWRLIPAGLLITVALIVLAGIALALATRVQTVPVLVGCAAILLLGLLSDYLFGRSADTSVLAHVAYRVIPNWQHFWLTDALTHGGSISWKYLGLATAYALACLSVVLGIGVLSFSQKEIS
jgi:hypothetical protein